MHWAGISQAVGLGGVDWKFLYIKKAPAQMFGAGLGIGWILLERLVDKLLKFHDVGGEVADALGGFFGGHGVFVEHQAEGFFIE